MSRRRFRLWALAIRPILSRIIANPGRADISPGRILIRRAVHRRPMKSRLPIPAILIIRFITQPIILAAVYLLHHGCTQFQLVYWIGIQPTKLASEFGTATAARQNGRAIPIAGRRLVMPTPTLFRRISLLCCPPIPNRIKLSNLPTTLCLVEAMKTVVSGVGYSAMARLQPNKTQLIPIPSSVTLRLLKP